MTDHDAEIVRAAEILEKDLRHTDWFSDDCRFQPLQRAIAAKREAMRPKLLSAEEAEHLYRADVGSVRHGFETVLTAAMERAWKAIEAAPRFHTTVAGQPGEMVRAADGLWLQLSDIRAALGVRP